jgi:hypothetical protein
MSRTLEISEQISPDNKCGFCTREMVNGFFIQCAECTSLLLCGDCFTAGVEVGSHKNTHSYRVPMCLENPIFDNSWTTREELLFLDGELLWWSASIDLVSLVLCLKESRSMV